MSDDGENIVVTHGGLRNGFEAIYRVVGRPDLAEGVRPSRRHPGKTYLQVKRGAKPATDKTPKPKPGVATRLIAPIRSIFGLRRSA